MSFWITTHWPRRRDKPVTYEGVWVTDKNRHIIDRVKPEDLVFIYEARSGPTTLQTNIDGATKAVARREGRGGVVALVRVTQDAHQPEDSEPEHYTNGTRTWWRYYAATESINSAGFIPQRQFALLLGHSPDYHFRGYGENKSGLREIEPAVFDEILAVFLASAQQGELQHITMASGQAWGGGGEGPEHLELKEAVANNPAQMLQETGLTLWAKEWPLPTSDKIDLVLKDHYGRFVAVEIEVDCGEKELAGPLQCMKYRAMLSYLYDRPLEEVRCILVARSIHRSVVLRCRRNNIECAIVGQAGSETWRPT